MKKISNYTTAVGFLLILFGFAFAFLLTPDRVFSEEENRGLRTLPKLTLSSLADGTFSSEMNDYFADQFPMRDLLVGQKGGAEIIIGKGENNGILLGKNGQLAKRLFSVKEDNGSIVEEMDTFDMEHIKASMEGIDRLSHNLDIPLSVFLTGRTIDVTASSFSYPSTFSDKLLKSVKENISSSVSYLDTVPIYLALHDQGEYVYYKTDHHWTTLGAYYAYRELMHSFGMEEDILKENFFEKQVVSTDFFGTLWSAGGMKFVSPDTMEIWYGEDESEYAIEADGKRLDGFYNLNYLLKKDKYSTYLDGTHDVVTITKKETADRPVLLLIKDSFANSLAPFLARHFDLVLLNLSSSKTDFTNVSYYAKKYQADRVALVYTLENVITADKLCQLK